MHSPDRQGSSMIHRIWTWYLEDALLLVHMKVFMTSYYSLRPLNIILTSYSDATTVQLPFDKKGRRENVRMGHKYGVLTTSVGVLPRVLSQKSTPQSICKKNIFIGKFKYTLYYICKYLFFTKRYCLIVVWMILMRTCTPAFIWKKETFCKSYFVNKFV